MQLKIKLYATTMDDEQEWEDMCNMSITRTLQRILDSSSDEEEVVIRGGSRPGKASNKERERELQAELLHRQYFAADPLYDKTTFRRRYRVSSSVYKKIKKKSNRWRTLGWNRGKNRIFST